MSQADVLEILNGAPIDRIPFSFTARCPGGHAGRASGLLTLPAATATIAAFRRLTEEALAAVDERCSVCNTPIRPHLVDRYVAWYEFEDGAGAVVARHEPDAGGRGWRFAYAPEGTAPDTPGLKLYGGLKNEDCRSELGRVFSLRDRWPELLEHYRLRGRTILTEMVAPGYACFVVRADCPAQVRSLARVTVPDYRPGQTHFHVPLDSPREPGLVLETVIDTDWVADAIDRISARLGRDGSGLDPRTVGEAAAAASRSFGEQVVSSLAGLPTMPPA